MRPPEPDPSPSPCGRHKWMAPYPRTAHVFKKHFDIRELRGKLL